MVWSTDLLQVPHKCSVFTSTILQVCSVILFRIHSFFLYLSVYVHATQYLFHIHSFQSTGYVTHSPHSYLYIVS